MCGRTRRTGPGGRAGAASARRKRWPRSARVSRSAPLSASRIRGDGRGPRAANGGDPAEAAAGAVRLALLPDDGPTGAFLSWDGTPVPW